jgi:hypothetical protein
MEHRKFRPGIRATVYPTTPMLLTQKIPRRYNILVGDDSAQQRFAEQVLGLTCRHMEVLREEDLLGHEEPLLYRVDSLRCMELSPNTKALCGLWSLDPIEKGSAGASTLVRFAASLLDVAVDKIQLQRVADKLLEEDIEDVRASLWNAVWLLTGPRLEESGRWPDPWAEPKKWLPTGVDPGYRLNSLYRTLVSYVFAKENDQDAARKFGVSMARFKAMQRLSLDLDRVDRSIRELSRWRTQKYNPLVCALKVTSIWNTQ